MTLIALGFRRAGILKNSITMEHYHDLGKWLFALTAFYTYIGVFAIPADLVREPAGRDDLVPAPFGRQLAVDQPGDAVHPLHHSVLYTAVPSRRSAI